MNITYRHKTVAANTERELAEWLAYWRGTDPRKVTHAPRPSLETPAYLRRLWPIDPRD